MSADALAHAIEAATKAVAGRPASKSTSRDIATIAVEAAAPHLLPDVHWALVLDEERQRAERAEAEVERLKKLSADHFRLAIQVGQEAEAERDLADRLADALGYSVPSTKLGNEQRLAALAAWEEARSEAGGELQ